jgi:hypothetical protein
MSVFLVAQRVECQTAGAKPNQSVALTMLPSVAATASHPEPNVERRVDSVESEVRELKNKVDKPKKDE